MCHVEGIGSVPYLLISLLSTKVVKIGLPMHIVVHGHCSLLLWGFPWTFEDARSQMEGGKGNGQPPAGAPSIRNVGNAL